ncbi:MAG TPA: hypothetical protein VGK74_11500 [Symbiobacteriaceae bacterium]
MLEQNPIVARYLSQFRAGLKRLPEAERSEVVDEINSHIAEAVAAGGSLAEVLERLGPADRLARAYAAEALLGLGQPTLGRWLKAAGVLAGFSLSSLFIIPVLGTFGVIVPIAAVWGVLANVLQFFYPAGHFGGTYISGAGPAATLVLGLAADVILFAVGIGAFRLLKAYMRLLIKTMRNVWS